MKNFSEDIHNLDDLGAVYLLLGPACNMTCRHCSQTPVKNCFDMSPNGGELAQDVKDFIVKWSKLPWKYGAHNPRRLYFWGGEPLLYWKTIKKLVLEFEALGVDISYRIFSNGLLLNKEVVEFCNEHDIWFIMSYDAPNPTAVRNTVPGERQIDYFLQIKKRTVNCVFNAINKNMIVAFKTLEYMFPSTEISCGFINVLSDIPKDIYSFKKGEAYKAVAELGMYLLQFGDKNITRWFTSKLWRTQKWDAKEFAEYPYPPCHPGVVSLSVDFKGNVYRCHNDSYKVGQITDDFSNLQDKHLDEWKKLLPPKCKSCEHLDICRCICPIAVKQGGELCYCNYLREFWQAVKDVRAVFKMVKPGKTYDMEFINGRLSLKEV